MNKWPNNSARCKGKGEMDNRKREIEPDELIEFAREYFAADFPNPDRGSCPDRATLDSLARSGSLPDDELRAHLFGCSNCFSEYRTALAERPQISPVVSQKPSWQDRWRGVWTSFIPSLRPSLAWTSAIALVIALSVWVAWRKGTDAPPQNVVQHSSQRDVSPSATAPSVPAPMPQNDRIIEPPVPRPHLDKKQRIVEPAVEATVSIDLNELVAMRGVSDSSRLGSKVIMLSPVRTRLKLRLPEGSLAGRYTVSLVDKDERAITFKEASSPDGRTLVATLDFKDINNNGLRLKIQRQSEPADFYPVSSFNVSPR